jgi:hypothetical protein
MAFEKAFQNNYHDLDQNTKYRFAEIEIGKATITLSLLHKYHYFPIQKAHNIILDALAPKEEHSDIWKRDFQNALNSTSFTSPPKTELIHYLILKGHTYKRIRDVTSASFNTISGLRYGLPTYYPRFNRWDEDTLNKWNDIKATLNLFNEELAHTKNN